MAKNLNIGALLDVYGPFLSKKQRSLCEHYYFDDLSLSEIAENEGITRQGARDIIHRAEVTLLAWESECHYLETFTLLKRASDDTVKNADEIKTLIDNL